MLELLPARVERVLDLGTGDGNTLALVLAARPGATGVGLDFQEEMLRRARERFAGDDRRDDRRARSRRTRCPTTSARSTSSCRASRSTTSCPTRQRALYGEVFDRLRPGGMFVERRARRVAEVTNFTLRSWPRSARRPSRTIRRTSSFPCRRTSTGSMTWAFATSSASGSGASSRSWAAPSRAERELRDHAAIVSPRAQPGNTSEAVDVSVLHTAPDSQQRRPAETGCDRDEHDRVLRLPGRQRATRDLAHRLADVWAAREVSYVGVRRQPAA